MLISHAISLPEVTIRCCTDELTCQLLDASCFELYLNHAPQAPLDPGPGKKTLYNAFIVVSERLKRPTTAAPGDQASNPLPIDDQTNENALFQPPLAVFKFKLNLTWTFVSPLQGGHLLRTQRLMLS
jgi:hypothetical protein